MVWIIEYAYGFSASRREGDIPFKLYNIEATIPPGTSTSDIRDMMKTLLVERFGFKFHIEKREMNALRLVIADEGHNLVSVSAPPTDFKVEGRPLAPGRVLDTFFPDAAHFVGAGVTFDQIAEGLSDVLKQPVLNRTDLEGRFNIDVKHRPEQVPEPIGNQGQDVTADYPFLREALKDYGLRLVEGKEQVEVLVIESLGEPSSN